MPRTTTDPDKAAIAEVVQMAAQSAVEGIRTRLNLQPGDVETREIRPTETLLRVKTKDRGTRSFAVQLRELM